MGVKATKTQTPVPVLLERTQGLHMGEVFENGRTRDEEYYYEWYDNGDDTCTRKDIVKIITTKTNDNDENIHIHKKNIETITIKEYFKRKLTGTLYGT